MYVTEGHAISAPAAGTDAVARELRDRAEILDALYRFGLGQDLKDGDRWVIRRMRIDNTWYTGHPAAIFG